MMTVDQSKARDFAFYNQMRRCTPDRFYEPILQKQTLYQLNQMGKFFDHDNYKEGS